MNAFSAGSAIAAPPSVDPSAASAAPNDAALSTERPFPGLRPFGFADRDFFFGRERQVFALYRLIETGRFIAVIGSSGSGKSSLVLAGLRSFLERETAEPGGPRWVCLEMRPGASPLQRLARALAGLAADTSPDDAARRRDRIEYRLRQSSFSFEASLGEGGGLNGRSLLLVVDQFEELFRFGLSGLGLPRAGLEETRARDEATQFVQILLDADRRRLNDVRVLITMRSDFIGECAYFHGLSEAVSATQYLVPNLTRSQLEEVIRKPIEKAGATIEPELVERLIIDSGDELDQLPLLQHCLMRLWDRAGETSANGPRRLTRQTYEDIGRMAEALSRHADEILRQCAGKELAVEQAFRALSELDREGRAIRRALRFDKLLAETGISEADLRTVLDRFRAPTCSFLVPPPATVAALAPDDRVDIGHETLLRRWKKLAGETAPGEAKTGRAPAGWLSEEQSDGQTYVGLLSLLETDGGGEQARLPDPERTKAWWDSRPRTSAWAERYGGHFDGVSKLIDDNIAAKRQLQGAQRRSRRNRRIVAAAILVTGALVGVAFSVQSHRASVREREAREQAALSSANTMLEEVLRGSSVDLESARKLAEASETFLRKIRQTQTTGAADALWVDSLNMESDLAARALQVPRQLELAAEARDVAKPLAALHPTDPTLQQKLYDSTKRVGDAIAASTGEEDYNQRALQEYQDALKVAVALVGLKDNETTEGDLIDAYMKIGDIYKIKKNYPEAVNEYRAGLTACETALGKSPQSSDLLQNRGNAHHRIAEALRQEKSLSEAEAEYRLAERDQLTLVQRDPNEPTLKSNLASTYNHWGLLARDKGDFNQALSKLEQGLAIQEGLVESDPTNPQWLSFAAPNYYTMAVILEALDRPIEARDYFEKLFDARRALAIRNPSDADRLADFAAATKAFGERSVGQNQVDAYREAVRVWKRVVERARFPPAAKSHYDDVFALAQALDSAKDPRSARTAYLTAAKIAQRNLVDDASSADWRDKVDRAQKGAESAANAAAAQRAGPQPAEAPH